MIDDETLARLAADLEYGELPPESFEAAEVLGVTGPARTIFAWSDAIRSELRDRILTGELGMPLSSATLIGVGIYRSLGFDEPESSLSPVGGFRLGVIVLGPDGVRLRSAQGSGDRRLLPDEVSDVPDDLADRGPNGVRIAVGGVAFPVTTVAGYTDLHASASGRLAAYALTADGVAAVTAGHVVDGLEPGRAVTGLSCHGFPTRLLRRAPGFVDAALVSTSCGCRTVTPTGVRRVGQGERVTVRLDDDLVLDATVMMSLEPTAELLSAAIPLHFLLSAHGAAGDSGAGVATAAGALCGIYLGRTKTADRTGATYWYGYAADLTQAAQMLDVPTASMGDIRG